MAAPESALSRRSTIAPISANEREERAQREIKVGLTDRLVSEQRGALFAHLVLLAVSVWLLAPVARPPLPTLDERTTARAVSLLEPFGPVIKAVA